MPFAARRAPVVISAIWWTIWWTTERCIPPRHQPVWSPQVFAVTTASKTASLWRPGPADISCLERHLPFSSCFIPAVLRTSRRKCCGCCAEERKTKKSEPLTWKFHVQMISIDISGSMGESSAQFIVEVGASIKNNSNLLDVSNSILLLIIVWTIILSQFVWYLQELIAIR